VSGSGGLGHPVMNVLMVVFVVFFNYLPTGAFTCQDSRTNSTLGVVQESNLIRTDGSHHGIGNKTTATSCTMRQTDMMKTRSGQLPIPKRIVFCPTAEFRHHDKCVLELLACSAGFVTVPGFVTWINIAQNDGCGHTASRSNSHFRLLVDLDHTCD
jgi:hypothetical protein